MTERPSRPFTPHPEQLALAPAISGNSVNGLGETEIRRPTAVYWRPPDTIPHGKLQRWYYGQNTNEEAVAARDAAFADRNRPLAECAAERREASTEEWVTDVKAAALAAEADQVGIARMRPEWVYDDREVDLPWMIVFAVAMDFAPLARAPSIATSVEVMAQYGRAARAANALTEWIRARGWNAAPEIGPDAGDALLIPAAIEAGLGELGKHGSMINRAYGASFRLAGVLTDTPLQADAPAPFGVDDFCANCQVCSRACPPDAIHAHKQLVRGKQKWYVDFDKCVMYFNENLSCAICLAVCPWSLPGVAPKLTAKLRRRAERRAESD